MKKWITKRAIPILLSSAMIVGTNSISIYGEDNEGICEHHTEHTAECGYQQGSDCTHEHTEECYNIEQNCIHEHTEECDTEQGECSHICDEQNGCITKTLQCNHEHNEQCTYVEETPCHYVCDICYGENEENKENGENEENKENGENEENKENGENEQNKTEQQEQLKNNRIEYTGARQADTEADAETKIEKPDGTITYDTLKNAFTAQNDGATITLQKDIEKQQVIVLNGNTTFTFDLNGFTALVNFTDNGLNIYTGKLTIKDSSGGNGSIEGFGNLIAFINSGTVDIQGGTLYTNSGFDAIYMTNLPLSISGNAHIEGYSYGIFIENGNSGELNITGNPTIQGESYALRIQNLDKSNAENIKISGGTFISDDRAIIIQNGDATVKDLLAEGYAYYKDSKLIADSTTLNGKILTGTIEVKPCEHSYEQAPDQSGKHICVVCGEEGECTYQYDNADSTETGHKGTCKVCGYKTEEQSHNFGKFEEESKDDGKNQVISYRATCQDCNYSKIVGTVSYPKNLKLEGTYGNTDDITLKVDVTGFENYETQYFWQENHTVIELKEQNFNYTLPNKVSAGKHTYTYTASFFIDSFLQGQINIDFTVDVKPLEITADIAGTTTKTYDGTVSAPPGLSIALNGVLSGDTVTANANFAYNSANVSEANVIKATNITLTGDKAKNYTLKENRAEIPANITKAQGVLIVPSAINKTFGDVPFLLQCSANSNGTITYTSSDENIAEVSQDGIVTLKSAGTVDIKASLSESENYTSAPEQKIAITVAKATPTVSCNVEQIEIFGISYLYFYITVTGVNGEALPTGYVEIIDRFNINLNNSIDDGKIELMTSAIGYAGNETFTVTYEGDNNYNKVVTTVTFDLNKKSQSDFNIEDVATKTYGDDAFELSTTGGNGEGSITYTSSDPNTLSINGTTATIKKAGTVIITAVKDGDAEYNSASASISITINKKDIVLQSKSYSVIKGQALPTYEYEPVELAYSDTMTAPTLTCNAKDSNTVGTYSIVISGGVLSNPDGYNVKYVNGTLGVSEKLYVLTVNNSGNGVTQAGEYAPNSSIAVHAGTRTGYTFAGWTSSNGGSFENASLADTIFIMPENDVTITANWKENSKPSSSSSSRGGGGGYTKPAQKTTIHVTGKTNINASVTANGSATVTVTTEHINDVMQSAKQYAMNKNANAGEMTAVIAVNSTSNNICLNIPENVQNQLIHNNISRVVLEWGQISVTINQEAIKAIKYQSKGTAQVIMKGIENSTLSEQAKNAVSDRPVYDIKLMYANQTKNITNINGISVAMQYTPKQTEQIGGLCAVYLDNNGNVEYIQNSCYDENANCVRFNAKHFSVYGIGYQKPNEYTDIKTHWAKNDIDFVASRNIAKAKTEYQFQPNSTITALEFASMLYNTANIQQKNTTATDINAWANEKGIYKNIPNSKQNQVLTRQDATVMLYQYAKAMGVDCKAVIAENAFADNSSILGYAKEAVKTMQTMGVVNGKDGNVFDPSGNVTRAEACNMIHNYTQFTIDTATAQGFTKNASGHWYYYQNGKKLTGWQTINGLRYYFNQNGMMYEGMKQYTENNHTEWHYWTNEGVAIGWKDISEKKYYFDNKGVMYTDGWKQIDNTWYYFYKDGSLAVNTNIDGYTVGQNGARV